MKQETRQWATAFVSWGSWLVAAFLTFLRTTGNLPQQYSMVIVLLIGFGVAAGVKLSRMRLTATMLMVYQAGVETARVQKEERDDMEQRITAAHHAHQGAEAE